MLLGKSIDHIEQPVGKLFVANSLNGYFNDLTGKVNNQIWLVDSEELPKVKDDYGNDVVFPVAIIQFGLGLYDLYLGTGDIRYKNKFFQCALWAYENQQDNGAWDNFSIFFPENPFGAMCQGEAASLLLRAYKECGENKYYLAAKKAIDYMLLPETSGGVTSYINGSPCFLECTNHSAILNGWIFALMGVYDMALFEQNYKKYFEDSLELLADFLPKYDAGDWSLYDLSGNYASPFYHRLHIAQLKALTIISNNESIKMYLEKFTSYENNVYYRLKAFAIKAWQKMAR